MEKIYRILLGIFLVCLIPILLVLSYWSCRYSYYGTVDYSIRNLLIKDSTWKHFVIFLLTSVLVYEGDKWLNAQNQEKQEKIKEELADVLNYCVLMADACGLDIDEIVQEKIKVNNEKYPVSKAKGKKEKYNKL